MSLYRFAFTFLVAVACGRAGGASKYMMILAVSRKWKKVCDILTLSNGTLTINCYRTSNGSRDSKIFFVHDHRDYFHSLKVRVCIPDSVHSHPKIERNCPKLEVSESEVECVVGIDRFDCLRRISANSSDFAVMQAEDLVAAENSHEYNVLVTNELRLFQSEKHVFEVVALMRNDAEIARHSDLRGKRLCHPGYETTEDWTPAMAEYLVNTIVEKKCDPDKTLFENRMAAASTFFEAACIAGPWSPDSKLDNELKKKYSNLCAICNSPSGCNSGDKYHGPEGALLCLTDNSGDIAWVRLAYAEQHFTALGLKKDAYSYLCPDGSVRSMSIDKPCIWISRPWPVVVARSDVSQRVAEFMASLDSGKIPWQSAFMRLMENYHLTAASTDNLETPKDYLERAAPGFSSANSNSGCLPSRTIKWCVASNVEDRKCQGLSQASFVYGIEPSISCNLELNTMACLEAVKNQQFDLVVINPQEEDAARRKGLKPILQMFTNDRKDLIKVAAVVKKDSKYKTLQDLKGSKACFTGYRSTGWNAFVSAMRNISGSDWDCSDTMAISKFFKESCVLGINENNGAMPHNLNSLCEQGGQTGGMEADTFKCLASGVGDVAFINLDTITQNTGAANKKTWAQSLNSDDFRSICFNNAEPEPCYLAWTTFGSVMVHQNTSDLRVKEIYTALLQIDRRFGRTFKEQTPAFSLYGIFDGQHSVIFPEKTQRLQSDVSHVRLQRNYQEIVEKLVKSQPCNKSSSFDINLILTIILCLVAVTPRN